MKHFSFISALLLTGVLAACSQAEEEMVYDSNSWKTIIPSTCLSFSDGCNNCRRAEGSEVAACTKKACKQYTKPECLDGN